MQLDKTQIAVHERGLPETLDLSLQVARSYAGPLAVTFALGAAPLMLLNFLLIGWMGQIKPEDYSAWQYFQGMFRYNWAMMTLVFLEAPLASVFATAYLGQAVFLERPSIWQVVRDVFKLTPRITWCQLIVRGILPVWVLYLLVERGGTLNVFVEVFLIPGIAFFVIIVRGMRPFMNEIILLERNPLRSTNRAALTIGRRSALLHGPSTADLILRFMVSVALAVLLYLILLGAILFFQGQFLNYWRQGPAIIHFFSPLSMWIVAGYFVVVRFLSYLDVRIRQEGWEVELRLRAEAARLTAKMT